MKKASYKGLEKEKINTYSQNTHIENNLLHFNANLRSALSSKAKREIRGVAALIYVIKRRLSAYQEGETAYKF